MQLQSNFISTIIDCLYINIFDCINFFHQWLIKIIYRHKFIVISHRNSEQWNVVVIKYRNNFVYVQRQIDRVFRVFRTFVKVYVNDIVMFNHSLKKHFRHLHQVFVLFDKLNIIFKSSKIYFDYIIISLLRQKINRFKFLRRRKSLLLFCVSDFSRR